MYLHVGGELHADQTIALFAHGIYVDHSWQPNLLRDSLTKLGYTGNKFTAGTTHETLPTVANSDGWIGILAANLVLVIPPLRRLGLEVRLPPLS